MTTSFIPEIKDERRSLFASRQHWRAEMRRGFKLENRQLKRPDNYRPAQAAKGSLAQGKLNGEPHLHLQEKARRLRQIERRT